MTRPRNPENEDSHPNDPSSPPETTLNQSPQATDAQPHPEYAVVTWRHGYQTLKLCQGLGQVIDHIEASRPDHWEVYRQDRETRLVIKHRLQR